MNTYELFCAAIVAATVAGKHVLIFCNNKTNTAATYVLDKNNHKRATSAATDVHCAHGTKADAALRRPTQVCNATPIVCLVCIATQIIVEVE
jgi:hypothetical protein